MPSRGECLQIEPVTHVHQNWGRLYDNHDQWIMKIKRMLDPNTVADWSAYMPPAYPEYARDGDYVLPSYGKKEDVQKTRNENSKLIESLKNVLEHERTKQERGGSTRPGPAD